MSFCTQLQRIAKPIWNAQLTHPFVKALGKGTLPKRKFKYYIQQDARFLGELARVFAAAAQKAPDADSALKFGKLFEDTILVERGLHESYGKQWKMTPKQMANVAMAPTNYAYTQHMLNVARTGTAAEITVVALPCAWIYCVVGQHLLKSGPPSKKHPYRDWLLMYSSPEFAEVQRWMRSQVDKWVSMAGEHEKQRMLSSFVTSSRYEWMFWEMAWREEKWPV